MPIAALIYRQTNKLDLALADYNKALAIDASYAPAYLGRGIVYRAAGQMQSSRSPISTRRSRCGRTMPRPITIAACSIRARASTQFAIDDFSTAIALDGQKREPFVARALSYLAVDDNKSATDDLDQRGAAQSDRPAGLDQPRPRLRADSAQKDKAAGSYAKALNINSKYQPAQTGFARVGGKVGQTYPTF